MKISHLSQTQFFRKRTGTFVYKVMSKAGQDYLGLHSSYCYGIGHNGNVCKLRRGTDVVEMTAIDLLKQFQSGADITKPPCEGAPTPAPVPPKPLLNIAQFYEKTVAVLQKHPEMLQVVETDQLGAMGTKYVLELSYQYHLAVVWRDDNEKGLVHFVIRKGVRKGRKGRDDLGTETLFEDTTDIGKDSTGPDTLWVLFQAMGSAVEHLEVVRKKKEQDKAMILLEKTLRGWEFRGSEEDDDYEYKEWEEEAEDVFD